MTWLNACPKTGAERDPPLSVLTVNPNRARREKARMSVVWARGPWALLIVHFLTTARSFARVEERCSLGSEQMWIHKFTRSLKTLFLTHCVDRGIESCSCPREKVAVYFAAAWNRNSFHSHVCVWCNWCSVDSCSAFFKSSLGQYP